MDSILDIDDKFNEAEAIKSYEYNAYLPTSGSNLNTPGNITIHIESQDEFYHPRRSYLLVEGELVKSNGTRYTTATDIALCNNGIMHLFSNARYEIGGQEIENVNNPGIAGVIMGAAKYPFDYSAGAGLMQCWAPNTASSQIINTKGYEARKKYIIANSVPIGTFSFIVELENVFGFFEDYDKVTYGMRQKLILVRKGDNDAIFRADGVDAGKVNLTKIAWMMPRVLPSDNAKAKLYKMIENEAKIDVGFRMRQCNVAAISDNVTSFDWRLGVRTAPEKPRHILIALQQDKSDDQEKNASIFDNLKTTQMSVVLNDTKYPARDVIADFSKHQYIEYYQMFSNFAQDYYGLDPLTSRTFMDPLTYKSLFPIFYVDVSKQSERFNQSVVDVTVHMRFGGSGMPKHVVAYALIISDRRMIFKSDGKRMNIESYSSAN